jgi:DHA2 family multidrug resistance protein
MNESWERFSNFERIIITIGVMTATLLQVLDTTIVNVALPHMQGSLGANSDEISWVLTSYLVSSAIFMPLTGYFTDRFGRRRFLLTCILGFVVTSSLCGAAESLTEIVCFRLLQGVFGAALVPLSQAILVDIYPPKQRGLAMSIWGVGVMVGPILGPTLGGYLTEVASWRWNFYINIPVGVLSYFLVLQFLPESDKKARGMDWTGFLLLSLAIAATQYFLDRGNHQDWFGAKDIQLAAFLAVVGWVGFIVFSFSPRENYVIDFSIFKDRNFSVSTLLLGMFGLGLFGAMVILPIMMEDLLNYPVLTTGLAMAPRGISSMVTMLFIGVLVKWVDTRILIAIGIVIGGIGSWIGTYYNLDMGPGWIIGPLIIQGIGLGLIFAPLSIIAFETLPAYLRSEASGVFSLVRTIGSSIGISMVITIYTRHSQMSWNNLGGFINPYNPAVGEYLGAQNLTINDPLGAQLLGQELLAQSQMVSMNSVFAFIAWSFVVMFLMLILFKRGSKTAP